MQGTCCACETQQPIVPVPSEQQLARPDPRLDDAQDCVIAQHTNPTTQSECSGSGQHPHMIV